MQLEFLRLILPNEGWYCAASTTQSGYFAHIWTRQIEELVQTINTIDRAGLTVYHACATYKERGTLWRGRKRENVWALKALWGDVDCGEDKPYPNGRAGAAAVVAFCHAASLPLPLFVNSGHGVHIYWPLAVQLPVDQWMRYATGLRMLAARHQFHIDTTRARDPASILRTPGTHNRKNISDIREVACGALIDPYPLETFKELLNVEQTQLPGVQSQRSFAGRDVGGLSVAAAILNGSEIPRERIDAFQIASGCAQFGAFVAERGNKLPYNLWRGCCALSSFTAQGDEFAHEYSKGDTRYTATECQSKIDGWVGGPPTCDYFHYHNPGACEQCQHYKKLHSPISLGIVRREPDIHSRDAQTIRADQPVGNRSTPINLPQHYAWGQNGELVLQTSNKGERVDIVISTHPIYLESVQRGEASHAFQLVFRQFLPQEGWREILIPAATMQTAEAFAALARDGGNVTNKPAFLEYTRAAIDLWHVRNRLKMNYEQFGWKESFSAFLFGDRLYTAKGVDRISGNKELRTRSEFVGPAPGYSLTDWQQRAEKLFARGTEAQAIIVIASFASVLMPLISNEGGVIIALISTETGRGKTVALIGGSSVWGRRKGLEIRREFSTITRGLTLATLGNLPIIFDEMRARDPVALRDFIKQYTEGGDKMRATRAGELKHAMSEWQNIMFTADNTSLVDLVSENDDVDEPAAMRIIELTCDVPKDLRHLYGDRLKDELNNMSGWAGDYFLRWLVQPQNLAQVRSLLEQVYQDVYKDTGWNERHRFWVRGITTIAVAGLLIKKLGIIDFDVPRIVRWLITQCNNRVRPRVEISENATAISALTKFLDSTVGERLVVNGPFVAFKQNIAIIRPHSGKLTVRYEITGRRYLIASYAWREWCIKHSLPWRALLDVLVREGVVVDRQKKATLGAGTEYEGGQLWCIVVDGNHTMMAGETPDLSNVVPLKQGGSSPPSSGASSPPRQE